MSTNVIDGMTEREAKHLLNDISALFSIGGKAATAPTILENVKNARRRSRCLSMIENYHVTTEIDDDGEEYDEQLLNWGESPAQYLKTYKRVLNEHPKRG